MSEYRSTGIVRRIDDLGRVVIPREIRRNMGIQEGDPFELLIMENGVYFRKYEPGTDLADRVLHMLNELIDDTEIPAAAKGAAIANLRDAYTSLRGEVKP